MSEDTKPGFAPTHEHVSGTKTTSLAIQPDYTFKDEGGKVFTKAFLERNGVLRRILPLPGETR